jgi:hypothetical protein
LWNEGEAGEKSPGQAGGGKGLFFLLASLSVALLLFLLWLLSYLLEPRAAAVGGGLLTVSRVVIAFVGLALVVVVASDFVSAGAGVRLVPGAAGQRFALHVLLPLSERLGRLAGVSPDRVKAAFIDFNNALLRVRLDSAAGSRGVLLLLPHCLQSSECSRVLGEDVRNCAECGQCAMCELKALVPKYGVQNRIVGGGTLALMAIRELRPKAVVGVACERELVAAMRELRGVPVVAVPNWRPCGPCRDTRVSVPLVEEALRILLKQPGSHCTID